MTKTFLLDLGERALKSFVQGAIAAVTLQLIAALANDPLDLSAWQAVGVAALGGGLTALFSSLTSLASRAKTGTASASLEVATSVPDGYDPKHDAPDDVTAVDQ